jgi:hypothetical protein
MTTNTKNGKLRMKNSAYYDELARAANYLLQWDAAPVAVLSESESVRLGPRAPEHGVGR